MTKQEQNVLMKRMISVLEKRFSDKSWIMMNKEMIAGFMVLAYNQAIRDTIDQGLEKDIQVD